MTTFFFFFFGQSRLSLYGKKPSQMSILFKIRSVPRSNLVFTKLQSTLFYSIVTELHFSLYLTRTLTGQSKEKLFTQTLTLLSTGLAGGSA